MSAFIIASPHSILPAQKTRLSPRYATLPRHAVISDKSKRISACTPPPVPPVTSASPSDTTPSGEVPFEIRGFSLANVGLGLGLGITIISFSSFISSNGTASATSLGFVYGVPILLIGCALKYAELQPVPVSTSSPAIAAREKRATPTQLKVYSDITRHRYGDEAHMSAALSSLGLVPRGEPCPVLERGREYEHNGEYAIELVFRSVATPYSDWSSRIDRFERFFGPNVQVQVQKLDAERRLVALTITSVPENTEATE